MSILTGTWSGQITGTNVGSFVLDLTADKDELNGALTLQDVGLGVFIYDASGHAELNRISLNLTPRVFPEGSEVGIVNVTGSIQTDGSLSGDWSSEIGTHGNFIAFKQTLSSLTSQTSTSLVAISYEKRCDVIPSAVNSEVLRRIYRDLSIASDEAAKLEIAKQKQTDALTGKSNVVAISEQYAQVRSAYSVIVTARGLNGEQKLALNMAILEEENLPKPLEFVEFNIGNWYQHIKQEKAPNSARIVLDFTKPPAFELTNPSLTPTRNNSAIEVIGNDSMWVSGVYEKLTNTLLQGRLYTGWLHTQYTYDILLILVGFPGAVSLSTIFGRWVGSEYFESDLLPQFAGFIFALFVCLFIFRLSFSFVRWLLPLVEFSPPAQPVHRQIRIAISTIIFGIIGSIAAAALWFVLTK